VSGRYRPDLVDATTQPRPFQTPTIPVWHGSASSTESTELAAEYGDPLFSANGFHPLEKYAPLIRHYRERWEAHGATPVDAVVGAGFNGLHIAPTSQEAVETYRPIFKAFLDSRGPSTTRFLLDDRGVLEQGSLLVGSVEQVIDKFGRYHELLATSFPALRSRHRGYRRQSRRRAWRRSPLR